MFWLTPSADAGPSPVNSYELWPADIQAMRELGVKVWTGTTQPF